MATGSIYYVTLPGMKREPITLPDTATVADFCREVFHRTGVTLFNGFGFKSQNDVSGNPTMYYTPRLGVITNVKVQRVNAAGTIQGTPPTSLFSTAQTDSRRGTETLMSALATSGDELIIFNVPFGE